MPRLLAVAALALLVGCSSSRESASPRGDGPPARPVVTVDSLLAEYDARLDLSDEQEESIRRTLDARAEALASAGRLPDFRSRRDAAERARFEADARIAAALTASQREAFDAIVAERAPVYDPMVEQRLAELRDRVGISSEQEAQIAPLLERQLDELDALRARFRPSAPRDERDAVLEEARELRERTDAAILALLDEDQADAYQRLIDERGDGPRGRRR